MNLLVEYCKRHKTAFVLPTNGGLCFFNDYHLPSLVCLTSNTPKSITTCNLCGTDESSMIIEILSGSLSLISHTHIHPDADILQYIKINFDRRGLTPVYLKTGKEIEVWLWKFFLSHQHKLLNSYAWKIRNDESNDAYEQMTYCAMQFPRIYSTYYTLYQMCTAGRKYLLFE